MSLPAKWVVTTGGIRMGLSDPLKTLYETGMLNSVESFGTDLPIAGHYDIRVNGIDFTNATYPEGMPENTPVQGNHCYYDNANNIYFTQQLPSTPVYATTLLVWDENTTSLDTYGQLTRSLDNIYIVVDIPIQDIYIDMTVDKQTINGTDYYTAGASTSCVRNKNTNEVLSGVFPVTCYIIDDKLYLNGRDSLYSFGGIDRRLLWSRYTINNGYRDGALYTNFFDNNVNYYNNGFFMPLTDDTVKVVDDWNTDYTDKIIETSNENVSAIRRVTDRYNQAGRLIYAVNNHNAVCLELAKVGLLVKWDNDYIKPVIENGVVTGYVSWDDDSEVFDSWTSIDKHDISPTPPPIPPSPDEDEIDEMAYGESAGLYGAVTYYTMTYVQLSSFISALEEATAEHTDIASGFVSAYYIPSVLDSIATATQMPVKVKGVSLSDSTGGKTILQNSLVLGTINVPVRHNNAFDTLTKYYLYTPYTDVIPLNYKCYGKTITVIMLPALQDCTASIIVQCDGMTIAKQTVSLGSSLAIAVENNAEKSTAIVNACSKYAVSAGGVIGGALTGNPIAVAGSAVGVVASTVNALNAIGNTYIHSYGTTTGTSLSLNPQNIYLIEYAVKPDKPSNYARTNGNLVNMEMEITSGMGYTKLGNPRVNTNLTAPEYAELINALENGVIL